MKSRTSKRSATASRKAKEKYSSLLNHDLLLNKTSKTKNASRTAQRKRIENEQIRRLSKNLVGRSFNQKDLQNSSKRNLSLTETTSLCPIVPGLLSNVESKKTQPFLKPKEEDKSETELALTHGLRKENVNVDVQEVQKKLKELVVKYFHLKKKLLDEEYNGLIALVSTFGSSSCALFPSPQESKSHLMPLLDSPSVPSLSQNTNLLGEPEANNIAMVSAIEKTTEKQLTEHFPLFSSNSSFSSLLSLNASNPNASNSNNIAPSLPPLAVDSLASLDLKRKKTEDDPIVFTTPAAPFVKELKSILKKVHFPVDSKIEQVKIFSPGPTPPESPLQQITRPSFAYAVGENLLKMERTANIKENRETTSSRSHPWKEQTEKEFETTFDGDEGEEAIFERRESESRRRSFDDSEITHERKKKEKKVFISDEWDFSSSPPRNQNEISPVYLKNKKMAVVSGSSSNSPSSTPIVVPTKLTPILGHGASPIVGARKDGWKKISNSKQRVKKQTNTSRLSLRNFSPLFSTASLSVSSKLEQT